MITFDSLTLKAFTQENADFFTGARIQKIQQPTRRDFVLTIRKLTQTKKLYININPKIYHICFTDKETEKRRRLVIPQKPPMFCMLLRKHLENSKIRKVSQPENERIFEIYVETYNELNEKIDLCLAIELMGKHSNIILYNTSTGIILGCAHNVGSEKSREREVSGTLPYVYPPKQNKIDILTYNGILDYENLSEYFYLFSKSFSTQCKGKTIDELKSYVRLENLNPAISDDFSEFSLFEELLPIAVLQKNVNSMIDNYYTHHQEADLFKTLKNHLASIVHQKLKRTNSAIEKMQSQIQREQNCDKYRLWGDIIMANMYRKKDYSSSLEAFDYENGKSITIPLDNTKTLKDNANKFYKLYNKGKTSRQKLAELKSELLQTKVWLEHIDFSINTAQSYEDLLEIKPELIEDNANGTKTVEKKSVTPEKIVVDDTTLIYVGKNNRQNDYIVSKLAKDEDLWFHVGDCAGSHVLLKSQNHPDDLILRCSQLAKKYSSASNTSKVRVIYTKCKYLKKPPKAKLGYVIYKNEKEILID